MTSGICNPYIYSTYYICYIIFVDCLSYLTASMPLTARGLGTSDGLNTSDST